ncbi:Alpha/Beta hydrolase protein [Scheffersomyces coipomensis]|uniref:Alpha/Beta hydrolase protein n=1 Tax=Scheffersomyces coipomensis TaxID=1788519 RepID=UPI00315D99F2
MYEELTPNEKIKKHNAVLKYIIIIISFFGSMLFVNILVTGSIFHHFFEKLRGHYKHEVVDYNANSKNGYIPRKAYPDIKSMKIVNDVRYYALQLNLDLEEYTITTEDGYVLTLHRLINPKETNAQRDLKKPILFQHGLMSSSGAFFTSGYNSLPFHFVELGYDVWLGNNRSYFEPKHKYFKNLFNNEQFWNWDIRSLAYYDLPSTIENVLIHKPNHSKLILVGHSQGGCQSFLLLKNGNLNKYHHLIEFFIPIAPACFPGEIFLKAGFLKFIYSLSHVSYLLIFGSCSFIRYLNALRSILSTYKIYYLLSYYVFNYLFGWNSKHWDKDKKVWQCLMLFNVVYISSDLMAWYLSSFIGPSFSNQLLSKKAYKNGDNYKINNEPKKENSYLPFCETWFDENCTIPPMILFTGETDDMVDGDRLIAHLRHYEPNLKEGENLFIFKIADYSHLDVIWAVDVIDKIGMEASKVIDNFQGQKNESLGETTEQVEEKVPLNETVNPVPPQPSSIIPPEAMIPITEPQVVKVES